MTAPGDGVVEGLIEVTRPFIQSAYQASLTVYVLISSMRGVGEGADGDSAHFLCMSVADGWAYTSDFPY